jgi:hypothetical protein
MKRLVQKILMLRVKAWKAALPCALLLPFALHAPFALAASQLPDFTYQGQLQQNGQPASGNFDLTFALFDASVNGSQIGSTIVDDAFPVTGGLFTVSLAFPGAFTGTQLWLEVSVNGVAMTPRTAVSTTPVAQYALTGAIANSSVTRASLNGTSVNGNIGFSLGAGACGNLTLAINGAQVGDLVVLSLNGVAPPAGIVFGPLSVTAAGTVKAVACNLSSSAASISNLAITIQTFR